MLLAYVSDARVLIVVNSCNVCEVCLDLVDIENPNMHVCYDSQITMIHREAHLNLGLNLLTFPIAEFP
jgi:hypothetical protein